MKKRKATENVEKKQNVDTTEDKASTVARSKKMKPVETKLVEAKQSDPHKEQRIALFVADAKEVKFTENGRIIIHMTTFTALNGLQKEVQTLLDRSGLSREEINQLLEEEAKWPKGAFKLLRAARYKLSGGYFLYVSEKDKDFFSLEIVAKKKSESDESESGSEVERKDRPTSKKFHLNIQAKDIHEYYRACTVACEALIEQKVMSFKVLKWYAYSTQWTDEQKGKTLTIYTYREVNKDWSNVIMGL